MSEIGPFRGEIAHGDLDVRFHLKEVTRSSGLKESYFRPLPNLCHQFDSCRYTSKP